MKKVRILSLSKAHSELLKSEGEGSRGGQVVGHTKSGKPIYLSRLHISQHPYQGIRIRKNLGNPDGSEEVLAVHSHNFASTHQEFAPEDHAEAAKFHEGIAKEHYSSASELALDAATHHEHMADLHMAHAAAHRRLAIKKDV